MNNIRSGAYEIQHDVDETQPVLMEMDVVVCGGESSGKSSCVERFLFDRFLTTRRQHEDERTYRHLLGLSSGGNIRLNILDTMIGNTVFGTQRYNWIEFADAFYLVYDLNDSRSFRQVHYYLSLIERVRGSLNSVPIILCGTKLDLVSIWRLQPCKKVIRPILLESVSALIKKVDATFLVDLILTFIGQRLEREIHPSTGHELANRLPLGQYFETSARVGSNIEESWCDLIRSVLEQTPHDKNCIVC